MRIQDTNPLRGPQGPRRKTAAGGASGTSFEGLLSAGEASGAQGASAPAAAAEVGGVDHLLALQSYSGETEARRQAMQQGHSMLDSLESLRRSLLLGQVPPSVLYELETRLAAQRTQVDDPALIALIDDIELRVAVEKAKLEQALRQARGEIT